MSAQAAPLTRMMAHFAIANNAFTPLARSREPLAAPLIEVTPAFDAPSSAFPALLFGSSRCAAPGDAALCNGTIAHALDYDDTNHPAYAHPSAVIVRPCWRWRRSPRPAAR